MTDPENGSPVASRELTKVRKKTRVTMYLEPDIIETFRAQAANRGVGYQTLINDALRQTLHPDAAPITIDSLRRVLREELGRHFSDHVD